MEANSQLRVSRVTSDRETDEEEPDRDRIDESDRATETTKPSHTKPLQRRDVPDVLCTENVNALQLPNPSQGRSEHACNVTCTVGDVQLYCATDRGDMTTKWRHHSTAVRCLSKVLQGTTARRSPGTSAVSVWAGPIYHSILDRECRNWNQSSSILCTATQYAMLPQPFGRIVHLPKSSHLFLRSFFPSPDSNQATQAARWFDELS